MEIEFYIAVIGITLVFHLPYAFITSKEIIDYPLWSKIEKSKWLIILWLLPFIGAKVVHKKLNLKIKGGATSGGDPYTCGGGDN